MKIPTKQKKNQLSSFFRNQVIYKNLIEITLTIWQQGYKWLSSFPLAGAGKSNGGFLNTHHPRTPPYKCERGAPHSIQNVTFEALVVQTV